MMRKAHKRRLKERRAGWPSERAASARINVSHGSSTFNPRSFRYSTLATSRPPLPHTYAGNR
jgi:hypothetical protein